MATTNPRSDSWNRRNRIAQVTAQIPIVVQGIYKDLWRVFGYDASLYQALEPILELVKSSSCALVDCDEETAIATVGVVSWESEKATINLNDRKRREKELAVAKYALALVSTHWNGYEDAISPGKPLIFEVARGFADETRFCDLMIVFLAGSQVRRSGLDNVPRRAAELQGSRLPGNGMFACLMFHWNGLARLLSTDVALLKAEIPRLKDDLERCIGGGILPLILDAFRNYERRFAAFPGRIRERYWQSINMRGTLDRQDTKHGMMPPWDVCYQSKKTVPTVTLSLDLRKSTYCMEYAESAPQFGRWLEMFTEKMRSVAHRHGGIYDKFTGDGSLVHFLEPECKAIYHRTAVDSAVHCAADMQRVVERHMQELRQFLQHDSPVFGAGIAIDVGEAHWACDDRDNPVVVGRGVVGACRAGDKALRYMIRLTNVAYRQLSPQVREKLREVTQVDLETKESTFPLKCWQFDSRVGDGLGYGEEEMKKLCREVYERFSRDQLLVGQAPACIP